MEPRTYRVSTRTALIVVTALMSGLVTAQVGQPPLPAKGTGFILGTILDAGSNQPIAGALVNLTGGAMTSTQLPTGEIIFTPPPPAGAAGNTPTTPRQIITDSGGRFLFRELGQGAYTIRATSPGYVPGLYGQNRPSGQGQTIVFEKDDERRGGLVLKMFKVATITGRVHDEFGEPAVEVPIRLVRKLFTGGRLRLSAGITATTDDRGVYRFANVTPGDYLVAVFQVATTLPVANQEAYMQAISTGTTSEISLEGQMSGAPFPSGTGFRVGSHIFQSDTFTGRGGQGNLPPPQENGRLLTYPTVFYPGVPSPSQATVLTLASGDERSSVDFQLKLQKSLSVSGTVSGPDGPMKNTGLRLLPLGAEEYASLSGVEAAVTATDASGAFTFLGVSPGTYTLQCIRVPRVQPPRNTNMTSIEVSGPNGMMMGISSSSGGLAPITALPTDPTLWGGMSVTVGETDVHGLSVTLRPGARVSGKLVFEGGGAPPPADVLQRISIQITATAGATPTQVGSAQKRIEADATFRTVGYPPGRYTVSASIPPPARGGAAGPLWRFKTAQLGGRDLTDRGLEIDSEDISGLTLVFTDRSTELTGNVVDSKGQPDGAALVVVVPADSQVWKDGFISTQRVRGLRTNSIGAFTIPNLPPGQYYLAAVSDASVDNWQDPKKLEAIARVGKIVTIAEGAKLSERLTTAVVK